MEKSIPKIGSRKTRRIGSRKNPRKIPKGVIYIQASFNNTIVTVTNVRGQTCKIYERFCIFSIFVRLMKLNI